MVKAYRHADGVAPRSKQYSYGKLSSHLRKYSRALDWIPVAQSSESVPFTPSQPLENEGSGNHSVPGRDEIPSRCSGIVHVHLSVLTISPRGPKCPGFGRRLRHGPRRDRFEGSTRIAGG